MVRSSSIAILGIDLMLRTSFSTLAFCLTIASHSHAWQAEELPTNNIPTVQEVAESVKPSIVEISVSGRDGNNRGVGTGFVISDDGLIATNLHVIGDARAFTIKTSDEKELTVKTIHASDRAMDLAIIRVEETNLPALNLGVISQLKQGTPIVVMGNPHGLKNSVVSGVNSGFREIDGRQMIQLAIPIEPGNSGGPVLDRSGTVYGVVTMKSTVTQNLGFAVTIDSLNSLLDKPNPIPYEKWLTIGAINPNLWTQVFGARWQQRGSKVVVSGQGAGFGGRSLCLSNKELPDLPYEVSVTVRMDDEAGAAGLALFSDGKDKHYGFYPTNNKMRLTFFNGSSVYSWNVLYDQPSDAYRTGDWNQLKIRVEEDRIKCFLNDRLIVEHESPQLTGGKVGLVKFRETEAEFREFILAREIPTTRPDTQTVDKLAAALKELSELRDLTDDELKPFSDVPETTRELIDDEVAKLELRVKELQQIASAVKVKSVASKLHEQVRQFDERQSQYLADPEKNDRPNFDLLKASLTIALVDEEPFSVSAYLAYIDQEVSTIEETLSDDATPAARLEALTKYMFTDNGYHGSRFDYYHQANSYMNRVIDDREGIPITLSVLFMEFGKRLGLDIKGIGIPGHFIVAHFDHDEVQYIDAYGEATKLTLDDVKDLATNGRPGQFQDGFLEPVDHVAILTRMLNNLLGLAQDKQDKQAMLRYAELQMAVNPENVQARGMRAILYFETGRHAAAIADLDWFLDKQPPEIDINQIRRMRDYFIQQSNR